MNIKSIGTNADKFANVDISKVHSGYFSDINIIETFINLGILPLIPSLPRRLNYVDFGGGQGQLATNVKLFLDNQGFTVNVVIADANEGYLKIAKDSGLSTELCNLEDCLFSNIDLITMRAVLHYNSPDNQVAILKNIFKSLNKGGYLIHQNSSGNKENCELRSLIVNIPELGRAGAGDYYWVSEEEQLQLLTKIGFSNITNAGYAKNNAWSPEEQWDRFNSSLTETGKKNNDTTLLHDIETRKNIYLKKANSYITDYCNKYGKDYMGIKEKEDGTRQIEYQYPITIAKK